MLPKWQTQNQCIATWQLTVGSNGNEIKNLKKQ